MMCVTLSTPRVEQILYVTNKQTKHTTHQTTTLPRKSAVLCFDCLTVTAGGFLQAPERLLQLLSCKRHLQTRHAWRLSCIKWAGQLHHYFWEARMQ